MEFFAITLILLAAIWLGMYLGIQMERRKQSLNVELPKAAEVSTWVRRRVLRRV